MYPGMVNSPETTITNNINESDTIIYVLDPARVPEPPNLMTLGTGTNAETVRVIEINDNAITVERGFQGVPKAWPAGTVIARNFTEYDYRALKENIEDLEANKETPAGAQAKAEAAAGVVQAALNAHLAETVQDETPPHGLGTIASSNIEDFIKSTLTHISGVTDWDTLTTTGFYFIMNQSDDINAPWGGAYNSAVIVLSYGTFTVQLAFKFQSSVNVVYFRQNTTTSGWSPWAQLLPTLFGTGAPEGTVIALVGTMYINTSDNSIYIKQTGVGNTGWKRVTLV